MYRSTHSSSDIVYSTSFSFFVMRLRIPHLRRFSLCKIIVNSVSSLQFDENPSGAIESDKNVDWFSQL